MLLLLRDILESRHPNWIEWDDSFSSESVKSKFRSNHTSQYIKPSNSLRGLSKIFVI